MTQATLMTGPQLRARYGGISEMTLFRWQHDERMEFPKPLKINKRKYYRVEEIEFWEKSRAIRA